jgi:hypothetical protein
MLTRASERHLRDMTVEVFMRHLEERRILCDDESAQIPLQYVPVFIGIFVVLIGLFIALVNTGQGLMWMGAGFVIGGFGGSLTFQSRLLALSGLGGMVLIVIGALFDQISRSL